MRFLGDDYNKNTYGIYSADYKSLMSGAIAQFASRGGNNFLMKPNLYVQYQSQVVIYFRIFMKLKEDNGIGIM